MNTHEVFTSKTGELMLGKVSRAERGLLTRLIQNEDDNPSENAPFEGT